MKKVTLFLIAALAAASVSMFTSCDGNGGDNGEDPNVDGILIEENITENTTWETGNVYVLGGRIAVMDGVTLTIEPGVIVKGQVGTGVNATALLVARGATIDAQGTADLPIIFTSVADELSPEDLEDGNFASPNLDPDMNGLWGGVIVLGKATISASNDNDEDISEIQIEGIPTSDPKGLYGGNIDTDNSGILKYISIRHGGANIGSGNEINGLSLGGVGSGTTIENIEIVSNQDDGIEWFGGTVNVSDVVVWNVGDDGIDTDQSWAGTLDNFFVITVAGHAFELDGPEGSFEAGHTIKNGTVITSLFDEEDELVRSTKDLINVDDNSIVDLENIHFTGVIDGQQVNRVSAAGVSFTNITIDVAADSLNNHVNGDVPSGITAGGSPVASASALSWTWAAQAGKLQ